MLRFAQHDNHGRLRRMWNAETKETIDRKLKALKPFDLFNSPFCTCGPKLTLNVYNGCGNECFYCYASSYSRGRWGYDKTTWGARRDIVESLLSDIGKIAAGEDEDLRSLRGFCVAVSLSSDPYPDSQHVKESELRVTRECLRRLSAAAFRILLQTKSDLVVRDLDVMDPSRTIIGMTITTDDEALASRIEPHAPPPSRRIEGLRRCAAAGFVTICRVDPLIPGLNTDERDIERLVVKLKQAGVRQIVSSTFKKKPDCAARFEEKFGRASSTAGKLYEDRRTEGYQYMRRAHRLRLLGMAAEIVRRHGLLFSCCREGFKVGDAPTCDGRHLLEDENTRE